jgi:hypothetical protein
LLQHLGLRARRERRRGEHEQGGCSQQSAIRRSPGP